MVNETFYENLGMQGYSKKYLSKPIFIHAQSILTINWYKKSNMLWNHYSIHNINNGQPVKPLNKW